LLEIAPEKRSFSQPPRFWDGARPGSGVQAGSK
jgi:hypothetical protein